MHDLYSTRTFEDTFTYSGTDLGATWTPQKTTFRLWAPTAEAVTIHLYRSGDPNVLDILRVIGMQQDVNGTWIAEEPGNLSGIYYTYLVLADGMLHEACDPYARTTGVNGRRGMILDLAATNPQGWADDRDPNGGKSITDAVIYELHIRDLSMHRSSHIRSKGKFLGLTEHRRKTHGGQPTGLDHIRDLGITHLHLLPVFDYGSADESQKKPQFNWGYDPMNFNVPEGSYATDPFDGAVRVREMKQMVKAIHDSGISVVMDVVYNHVHDSGSFCFNQIVPGYFSRISEGGHYSNGSCCGNDTASERTMVRKYIVDSVCYWAEEYHIDGFRFDLVGLIDIQTINEVIHAVHRRHPNVIFYGEGWTMDTELTKPGFPLAVQGNSDKMPGFSFFSDTTRDLLRGSIFCDTDPGFVAGAHCDKELLHNCFMGNPGWASQPCQCVNYVSCHDNHTLFDRIALTAPEAPWETRIRMNNLAAAFVMLSQGVPFFQAGEEILRTKPGKKGSFDHNSYRSPDRVNSIKWDTLDREDYLAVKEYYRGLIAFRKAHPALRLKTRTAVSRCVHPIPVDSEYAVAFLIEDRAKDIFVIFNADPHSIQLSLPQGKWDVCIRDGQAGTETLDTVWRNVTVAPVSAMVMTRKKPVDVVAALIWEKDKFLICQRPANKARGLLWEFVGGKVEPGETFQQALTRECAEELAIQVEVGDPFMEVVHDYPDLLIRLTLFHCTIPHGFPQALEHNALEWIHPSQTDSYEFCPADTDILKEIKRRYQQRKPL